MIRVKDTMLVPILGMAFVMTLALTLIVKVVIFGPYTHHNIRPSIDLNYDRTVMSFVGANFKTSNVVGLPGLPGPSVAGASMGEGGPVVAGKAVVEKNCSPCHPGGHKGIGPDLGAPDFKTRYPQDADVAKVIRGGRNVMPAWSTSKVSDDDLTNVIAFIRSLSGGSSALAATDSSTPAATGGSATAAATATSVPSTGYSNVLANGQVAFDKNCGACHPGGGKGTGPALNSTDFKRRYPQDSDILAVVRTGSGGKHAVFSHALLTDGALDSIVSYLRSLVSGS